MSEGEVVAPNHDRGPSDENAIAGGGHVPATFAAEFSAFLLGRPSFLAGYIIIFTVAFLAFLAPFLPLHSPTDADTSAYLLPPNLEHPMGTDTAGLDILSRVLHAPRVDLAIALISTLWAAAIGGAIGAYVGLWEGGRKLKGIASTLLLRTADVIQAFPVFALALVLVAVLGQGMTSIIVAIGVVNIPVYLRLMRSEVKAIRAEGFVESAKISGASDTYILLRHIVPNSAAPILAQMSVNASVAVLLAAGLSFIGAGVRAPTPEWGSMIAMGFQNIVTGQWWPSVFPGLGLALTVFGLGRIGASIQAWSNPRERSRPSRRAWNAFVQEAR